MSIPVAEFYEGVHRYTAYFFSQAGTDQQRIWDIHDDEELQSWQNLFEEAPA
jgi:hypothetical protein